MKIALIGYGKMGRIIETLAVEKGDEIVARIDENNNENLIEQLSAADAAIDFSNAEAIKKNVEACLAANIPLVEGTTGWNSQKDEIKNLIESKNGAFVFGANFSIGVNLFYRIADFASELFCQIRRLRSLYRRTASLEKTRCAERNGFEIKGNRRAKY